MSSGKQWQDYMRHIFTIFHSKRYIAPWGALPVTVTSGVGAYVFGGYSADILAAGALGIYDFHIENVIITASDAVDYELSLVYGAGDTEFAQVNSFGVKASSQSIVVFTDEIPAGSRVRARVRDSVGGKSVTVKIGYHLHPQGL